MEIRMRSDFGHYLQEKGVSGDAAEIGVAEGRYSREILSWNIGKLYMVDVWRHTPSLTGDGARDNAWHEANYQSCLKLADESPGRAVILRGLSTMMAAHVPDGSLSFIHLDATHKYEPAMCDFRAWWPKLKVGGVFSGHDYLVPQYTVKQAADEFAAENGLELHVIDEDRINDACFWFERTK